MAHNQLGAFNKKVTSFTYAQGSVMSKYNSAYMIISHGVRKLFLFISAFSVEVIEYQTQFICSSARLKLLKIVRPTQSNWLIHPAIFLPVCPSLQLASIIKLSIFIFIHCTVYVCLFLLSIVYHYILQQFAMGFLDRLGLKQYDNSCILLIPLCVFVLQFTSMIFCLLFFFLTK